jgi:hypothetical protein
MALARHHPSPKNLSIKPRFPNGNNLPKINGIGPSEALMRELIKRKIPPIELRRQPEFRKKLYGLPKLGPKLK